MKKLLSLLCVGVISLGLFGCSCKKIEIPAASAGVFDMNSQSFGVDKNINVGTIDNYLNLENVVYRDMRLLVDSQGYDDLTPTSSGMLTATIEGFRISSLPYIANLWEGMLPPGVLEDYQGKDLGYTPLFNVVWKENGEIEFLRKIVQGGASKSYGIQVAKMAGLPNGVISRSQELMQRMQKDFSKNLTGRKKNTDSSAENLEPQLNLF